MINYALYWRLFYLYSLIVVQILHNNIYTFYINIINIILGSATPQIIYLFSNARPSYFIDVTAWGHSQTAAVIYLVTC